MIAGVIIGISVIMVLTMCVLIYKIIQHNKKKLKELELRQNQLFLNRARILHNRNIIKNKI